MHDHDPSGYKALYEEDSCKVTEPCGEAGTKVPGPQRYSAHSNEKAQCGRRLSSQEALQAKIAELRREACALEKLLGALPRELPMEADEALLSLLIGHR